MSASTRATICVLPARLVTMVMIRKPMNAVSSTAPRGPTDASSPGTPAAEMADQVSAPIADERLQRLQALINEQQHAFNRATLGRRTQLLIEREGKLPGQKLGKTPWLQSAHLRTDAPIGAVLDIEIVAAGPNSVSAAVVDHGPPSMLQRGLTNDV